MTIIVFNKPLNEIAPDRCKYPLFSIHTEADVSNEADSVEVLGNVLQRWHGLKIEMVHVASVYAFKTSGGISFLENGYPKSNNTCS